MRKQKAVYWARTSPNEFGQLGYAAPVEISCRWDDATEEFIDSKGTKQQSRAVVYVDRDMQEGDKLKLARLTDLQTSNDSNASLAPENFTEVWEVRRFDKNPNLKATEFLRTAYL